MSFSAFARNVFQVALDLRHCKAGVCVAKNSFWPQLSKHLPNWGTIVTTVLRRAKAGGDERIVPGARKHLDRSGTGRSGSLR